MMLGIAYRGNSFPIRSVTSGLFLFCGIKKPPFSPHGSKNQAEPLWRISILSPIHLRRNIYAASLIWVFILTLFRRNVNSSSSIFLLRVEVLQFDSKYAPQKPDACPGIHRMHLRTVSRPAAPGRYGGNASQPRYMPKPYEKMGYPRKRVQINIFLPGRRSTRTEILPIYIHRRVRMDCPACGKRLRIQQLCREWRIAVNKPATMSDVKSSMLNHHRERIDRASPNKDAPQNRDGFPYDPRGIS